MKLRRAWWIPIVLCAALTAIAPTRADDPEPIATLQFADADGRAIALDEPGVLYLVDFWALGCGPCMAEMPELERLAQDYEPGGRFRLVSVVAGGWKGHDLRQVAKHAKTDLEIYSDPDDTFGRLDINRYPTKLLVRDGVLLRRAVGGGTGAYRKWSSIIDNELESPPDDAQR